MALMPGAKWEPITGHSGPGMRSYTGVVLHCNDANSVDLRSYFQESSGDSAVSSHFQVTKDGTIYQYIDTKNQSWCQKLGNPDYLSIESEGLAGAPATPQQVASIGRVLAWAHKTHGIPLHSADKPGDTGLGWHGMGAPSWGHAVCPGVRKDQRVAMLAAAGALAPTNLSTVILQEDDDMPTLIFDTAQPTHVSVIFGGSAIALSDGASTKAFEQTLKLTPVGLPTADYERITGALHEGN